jgi:hypothetical protein
MKDSKGDVVGAGRRVVDEFRTGGRLGLFATGGRLVERERLVDVLLLDARVAHGVPTTTAFIRPNSSSGDSV